MNNLLKGAFCCALVLSVAWFAAQAGELKAEETAQPILCSEANAETPILLAQTSCPGQHTCITTACGTMSDQVFCCPQGYRYLNHCDCLCYSSNDFNCNSYSWCN